MMHIFTLENGAVFLLQPLRIEDVEEVRLLCDECVGKNLYSADEIAATLDAQDKFFYLLKNEDGETVGYIYYYLTDQEYIAKYSKLNLTLFRDIYAPEHKKVGKIQAVGLQAECRGSGLAAQMIRFILDELKAISIEAAFIVCWKPGGMVPLGKALRECDFYFLSEAKKVWYDNDELICPYCNGRCLCAAEVYYKLL